MAALVFAFLISPKADSYTKSSTYECGMNLYSDAKIQYNVQFFMYAVLFLVFDIETILLFPFALVFDKIGFLAFIEAGIFVLLLLLGLVYAAKKNMLRFR